MRRRTVASAVVLALVVGFCAVAQAAPAAKPEPGGQVVTLVTGDRVVLGDHPRIVPGQGRADITFHTSRVAGELTVVPSDAAPLLTSGRLDPRLFNVTALARDGFDDSRPDLPLIVTGAVTASVVRELPVLGGSSVLARKSDLTGLWKTRQFSRIWLNGKAHLVDDVSNAQIGAPAAWQAGFTGKGVTVADLDGGYDATHPDLANVAGAKDFTGTTTTDENGHGTHTASTIAGTGTASAGRYAGVAPDARLLIGKVCTDGDCQEDAIIAGMQWAADQGATVVNLSLGGGPTDGRDPLSLALNRISAASGTLFVVAAGNSGAARKVGNPASADLALAVGSVTKRDELSRFSSQGPRLGDDALKPDITAPGSDIIAARAAGTSMGTPVDARYTSANGTSMATPHVTGAAALLAQQHPTWKASELKAALMNAATPLRDLTVYQQGAGRLDIGRAVAQQVRATAGSVSFGRFPWPRNGKPVTRKVSFANSGTEPMTLNLTAPDVIALSGRTLTVPAGGSASVDLTFTPRVDGLFSGWLTATSGTTTTRVALGASVEPESYDVTVRRVLRGEDDESWFGGLVNVTTGTYHRLKFLDGDTEVLRLPKGRYDLVGFSESSTDGKRYASAIAKPNITVSSPVTVVADEKAAKAVSAKAGKAKLNAYQASLVFGTESLTYLASAGTALYATPTSAQSGRVFGFSYRPVLTDGASVYNLVFAQRDRVPSTLAFEARDLASVRASYYVQGAPASATRSDSAALPWDDTALGFTELPVPVPGTRTEYFTSGADVTWRQSLALTDGTSNEYVQHVRSFPRGGSFTDEWNRAPIGPVPNPVVWHGDTVDLGVALFAPGDASSAGESDGVSSGRITGTSTLSRDGVVIGRSDEPGGGTFTATPGPLTLSTTAVRSQGFSVLGTRVDATWTFDGQRLLCVRTSGKVDSRGRAPEGPFDLAVRVDGNAGAVTALELSASFDDGRTWTSVPVSEDKARIVHPAGDGFVSLRGTARDASGNTVDQTVIRAYQYGR
ncbi:S8 family serine peptidase [Lentzea tibetensis]|uniref:S8 family serine peptidase n=1 Tax=Lentzea tibetensis TaxID=2591470 RepID=A0A563EPB0_9PSEU|nr:S8 family serine peptidase [Lentzea tibetensis]TWP49045.1 S8 family serine peptidase [Lentzea tibetensis]